MSSKQKSDKKIKSGRTKTKKESAENKQAEKLHKAGMTLTEFSQSILLTTETPGGKEKVEQFLQQHSLLKSDKPTTDINWFNTEGESLKIKTVREIIQQTSYTSYSGQRPIYILLNADNSSIPAQNALLKVVEEPPHGSLIILTAQQPKQLLPTIRSRCVLINLSQPAAEIDISSDSRKTAEQLIAPLSYSEAIELAEKYKDRAEAQEMLSEVINYLHQKLTQKPNSRLVQIIQTLLAAHQDISRNLNTRLALEHYFFQIKRV